MNKPLPTRPVTADGLYHKGDQRDLDMMRDQDRWPLILLLPMKRSKVEGYGMPDLAVLIANDLPGQPLRLYIGAEVHCFPRSLKGKVVSPTEFPNAEAILDAGWRVD